MKKTYVAPKLASHGTVAEITTVSRKSNRRDTLFGPPNATTVIGMDMGSSTACIIKPDTTGPCL